MDLEFYYLYNTVSSFDQSIVKNLQKIDHELSQAVREYRKISSRPKEPNKLKITTAMLEVLESYNKIVFLTESALESLRLKLFDINQGFVPEKDNFQNSKPFNFSTTDGDFAPYAETSKNTKWQPPLTIGPANPLQITSISTLKSPKENVLINPKCSKNQEVQMNKITYSAMELINLNPYNQGKREQNKWKSVPTSLLNNFKEKETRQQPLKNLTEDNNMLRDPSPLKSLSADFSKNSKLPRDAESSNISSHLKEKSRAEQQTNKITYSAMELLTLNPFNQEKKARKQKTEKNEWKTVPPTLLKNIKEKRGKKSAKKKLN